VLLKIDIESVSRDKNKLSTLKIITKKYYLIFLL